MDGARAPAGQRIAIVGTGIAGLTVAHRLHRRHELTLYEAEDRVGGHTHTVEVEVEGEERPVAVDTGFIVFNSWTYPRFEALLAELGVATLDSTMSFSVRCEAAGLEYNGTTLDTLFAQRRNLLRPSFLRMVRDILRFNRRARSWLRADSEGDGEGAEADLPFGEFLARGGFSRAFVEDYAVPMSAAIWSASAETVRETPARFLLRFFDNHGMLSVDDRPTWRVVRGGSARYVEALIAPFRERIRLREPVSEVRRLGDRVEVTSARGTERFDQVVLAAHSDQALALLADPSPAERAILGALPYQSNEVVLHRDASLLPRARRARAAWNYHRLAGAGGERPVAVTYWMNELQRLDVAVPLLVTLNRGDAIDPGYVLGAWSVRHPVFGPEGVAAQERFAEISGLERRTHYCGAYWRYGFHEDGVWSGLRVAEVLDEGAA
ncbi:MAG TPA: FAD-dependent oxidoreductase [Thermoanaerobaculia bacterium]|nr:FAD-dependent oxidoreductase [Thermoanaerobaculia bacterium]